jgi:hypothetical protein
MSLVIWVYSWNKAEEANHRQLSRYSLPVWCGGHKANNTKPQKCSMFQDINEGLKMISLISSSKWFHGNITVRYSHPQDGGDVFCETSVQTRVTRCNTPEDIRHSYRRENNPEGSVLRPYTLITCQLITCNTFRQICWSPVHHYYRKSI